jgi:hypothetical protein
MKKVNDSNLELLHSALTQFVGEPITQMSKFEDDHYPTLIFQTHSGTTGLVSSNYVGNMDVWIGENVVYEIEKDLYELLEYDKKEIGLIEFYNHLKLVDTTAFKSTSKHFFNIVKTSTENIILNFNLPLVGDTKIAETQIHYTENQKMKFHLN